MANSLGFYDRFRQDRLVITNDISGDAHPLTLFLGLYNSLPYLDDLKNQLLQQKNKSFQLIMVDNHSNDETFTRARSLLHELTVPVTLVKNPINIGFHGSLNLNEDLISTPWVGFMNQDDVYLHTHTEELARLIHASNSTTVAIGTSLGSVSQRGMKLASLPRASWYFRENEVQTRLLCAAVQQHTIPEPSIAYRTSALRGALSPWHSTAFPDTEILLQILTMGGISYSSNETVLYRESESSASHHLSPELRDFGAYISLVRFFNGARFKEFIATIPNEDRDIFTLEMLESIEIRLKGSKEEALCKVSFLEAALDAWNYDGIQALCKLSEMHKDIGATRAQLVLERVRNFSDPTIQRGSVSMPKTAPPDPVAGARLVATLVWLYQRIALALPRKSIRLAWTLIVRMLPHEKRFVTWSYLMRKNDRQR